MPHPLADRTGQRFWKLTAVSFSHRSKNHTYWTWQCDCGRLTVAEALGVKRGHTRSCGCLHHTHCTVKQVKHGGAIGGKPSAEYRAWQQAKDRCYNQNARQYRWYGALGVVMHEDWRNDCGAFMRYMGPRPTGWTLDRINPHGNYEPGNCRWASWAVQRVNKRRNTTPRASAA